MFIHVTTPTEQLQYTASERVYLTYLTYLAKKLGKESAAARAESGDTSLLPMAAAITLSKHASVMTRAKVISPELWEDLIIAYGTITRAEIEAKRARVDG